MTVNYLSFAPGEDRPQVQRSLTSSAARPSAIRCQLSAGTSSGRSRKVACRVRGRIIRK
jgi:hypothetical protein